METSNCNIYNTNRVKQLSEIQSQALELFARKNADYGDAFAKYGLVGVLMRIEDKIQRCISITKNGINLVSDEGLKDTLLDLHNYSAMASMLYDEGQLNLEGIIEKPRLSRDSQITNPRTPVSLWISTETETENNELNVLQHNINNYSRPIHDSIFTHNVNDTTTSNTHKLNDYRNLYT